jgi:hypothetical protein
VTDLFDAAVADAGRTLERAVARDGSRGVGVATRNVDGSRELVSVVGPDVDPALVAEHPGWDLPLADVRRITTSSGPRTFIAERLPAGVPSTWIWPPAPDSTGGQPKGASSAGRLPPFCRALVERVVSVHEAGDVVGPLHPAVVLVGAGTAGLLGVAQRPLRVAAAIGVEGDRPLFGYGHLAPNDVVGGGTTASDDVFRLGLLVWGWRHGTHPLGHGSDSARLATLAELAAGRAVAGLPTPGDSLDALLLACLGPSPADRPSARELRTALAAA